MSLNKQREFQILVTRLATEFINLPLAQFDVSIERVLREIGEFIGADRAYIYHFTPDLSAASMIYEWCSPNTPSEIKLEQNIPTNYFSAAFQHFKQGEPDIIHKVSELGEERQSEKEMLLGRGIAARITFPLFNNEYLIGSMGFHAMRSNPDWADYTVDLLKIVAEIYLNLLKRRKIEQELQFQAGLLQNVTDAIIATDMGLIITSWNRAAEQIYGYTAEQVIGKHLEDIIQSEFPNSSRATIVSTFSEMQRWEGEVTHHDKHGQRLELLVSISAIKDADGKAVGAVFVCHDIAERKQAENHQIKLAVQSERIQLLEQIISDLSHDIKTPLASIKLNLYMIQKTANAEKQSQYAGRMSAQIQRLTRLVDDILLMSRLDKGALLTFTSVNLTKLLEELAQTYYDLVQEKQNSLTLDISPNLPSVLGNEAELSRALGNLIENAITYTPAGKTIVVKAYARHHEVIVVVEDAGIGIAEADLPHIFDRFYRSEQARSTSETGTGLGLAIVKRIVELHEGIVEVNSMLDKGTTFRVRLPNVEQLVS